MLCQMQIRAEQQLTSTCCEGQLGGGWCTPPNAILAAGQEETQGRGKAGPLLRPLASTAQQVHAFEGWVAKPREADAKVW